MNYLKKLIYLATITLMLFLFGTILVFCHETNSGNQPKTWVREEPTKIIVMAMYVDPEHPEPGDEFVLGFLVKNNSTVTTEDLNVTINLPAQLELVSGSKKVHLGNLGPNQERFVSWRIRANASADCIIMLHFETSNMGTSQSEWLLEIYPKFSGILLNPWFQLFAIIVLVAAVTLVIVFIRKHTSQRNRHSRP